MYRLQRDAVSIAGLVLLEKIELQQAMCRSVPDWLQLSFVLVRYLDIVTLSEFCGAKRCVLGNTILLGAGPECAAV